MSRETANWLNSNILVGFTERRGNAWHYRADLQTPWDYITEGGDLVIGVGNHYSGAIPLADVKGRLFNWEPLTGPVFAQTADGQFEPIPNTQRVYPSDDPSQTFYIAKDSYVAHEYGDTLGNSLADLLDTSEDDLGISSAGLLKGRAIAWVEVSIPDSITTPEGIDFRPNLLATTSLNGTVATTWKRTVTETVCDNTWGMAMSEKGQTYKIRHSKYSNLRLADAREALAIIHSTADEIAEEFAELCRIDVTDRQFYDIIGALTDPPKGKEPSKRGTTLKEKKMGQLSQLWNNDNRVSPWKNTGYGVVQAVNTWEHHFKGTQKGTSAAERNMLGAVTGEFEKSDREVYNLMLSVLDNA
jgi:phage/plasmid-like protein (TIGR03299 family)